MADIVVLVQKWWVRFLPPQLWDSCKASDRAFAGTLRLMAEQFTVLIMAAGHGTRMRSSVPKVLHPVAGKPMVQWVIDAGARPGAGRILCVVRPGDGVAEGLPEGVEVVEQTEGEGTGVGRAGRPRQRSSRRRTVVVLSADHPLGRPST